MKCPHCGGQLFVQQYGWNIYQVESRGNLKNLGFCDAPILEQGKFLAHRVVCLDCEEDFPEDFEVNYLEGKLERK